MEALSDAEVVAELKTARTEAAAARLYELYGGELFAFARQRLGDRSLAEEVVQETFMRVWHHARAYDPARGSGRTWLYGIARHALVDSARQRARRPPLAGHDPDREPAAAAEPLEGTALRWQVAQAFERLSPDHREVLRLGQFAGLSVEEISQRPRIAPGTVKSRTYYAIRSLRAALDEFEDRP
jgi:RNA polymerase sigma-70 factor, ECF subfamily